MEAVAEISRLIDREFGPGGKDLTGQPMSALVFVPPISRDRDDARSSVRRSILNNRLKKSYSSLQTSGYLAIDPATRDELWRISVRVAAFKDVDYGAFTDQLKEVVDPFVREFNAELEAELGLEPGSGKRVVADQPLVSVVYTGVIPIVYKAQRALLDSLIESTFWSFITITPLLMIVSRGILPGIAAMLPNTLPVLVVFGGMGWLGVSVTIGSMMSASIALGVAVPVGFCPR